MQKQIFVSESYEANEGKYERGNHVVGISMWHFEFTPKCRYRHEGNRTHQRRFDRRDGLFRVRRMSLFFRNYPSVCNSSLWIAPWAIELILS